MHPAGRIRLSNAEIHRLADVAEAAHAERAQRARALLLAHWGVAEPEIATLLRTGAGEVRAWLDAFALGGLARVVGTKRRARKDAIARIDRVRAALDRLGVDPAVASVREVAAHAGLPTTTTYRILRELPLAGKPAPASEPLPAPVEAQAPASEIAIVGCGGAGTHVLDRLHALGLVGASTLALDTDKARLDACEAHTKFLIGKTTARGAGAGGDPEIGARAAEAAAPAIAEALAGARLVFVVAGLGAGTGTGAAPVVARIARETGAVVVAVATTPFHVERSRIPKAEHGLAAMRGVAHTTLVLDDDRLLRVAPNLPIDHAFRVMDSLLAETLKGIVETLTQPALLRLDPSEVRSLFEKGGRAGLLVGESRAVDPRRVVQEAMEHAFHADDAQRATGVVAHVTGGPELSLATAQGVADELAARMGSEVRLTWGASASHAMRGRLRLLVVLTGMERAPVRTP